MDYVCGRLLLQNRFFTSDPVLGGPITAPCYPRDPTDEPRAEWSYRLQDPELARKGKPAL